MQSLNTAYCFDLDGVVTAQELLPLVAQDIGCYEEMRALTLATINGIIPFESSFRLRCKILAEVPISKVRAITAQIELHQKIVWFIRSKPKNCFIVTGNLDVWIEDLVGGLGVKTFSSTADRDGDRLQGLRMVMNKGAVIEELRPKFDRIVTIGDGMGDVPMFERADVRIAFGAVHPPIDSLIQLSEFVCFSEEALCQTLSTL
jgi:phosphoserine phosphatase